MKPNKIDTVKEVMETIARYILIDPIEILLVEPRNTNSAGTSFSRIDTIDQWWYFSSKELCRKRQYENIHQYDDLKVEGWNIVTNSKGNIALTIKLKERFTKPKERKSEQ